MDTGKKSDPLIQALSGATSTKRIPLFKESANESLFQQKGIVNLSFLSEEICEQLLAVYHKYHYKGNTHSSAGFYTGEADKESLNRLHSETISRAVRPFLSLHFHRYQIIRACYIVKPPDPKGWTPIHQDWTFVDEEHYDSCTLWCALHSVSLRQGALCAIEKSHVHMLAHRPSPSPPYVPPFASDMMTLFPRSKHYELKRGEAVVFHHRLLHGALPNQSTKARIAIGLSLAPKDAPLQHHYLLPDRRHIAVLAVKPEFFLTHSHEHLRALHESDRMPKTHPIQSQYPYKKAHYPASLRALVAEQPLNAAIVKHLQAAFPTQDASAKEAPEQADKQPNKASDSNAKNLKKNFWQVYTLRNIYLELIHRLRPIRMMLRRECIKRQHVAQLYNEQHKAFQDVYGDVIQAFRTKPIEVLLDYELKQIGIADGDYVLDAGCGVGGPALYFAQARLCQIEAITLSDMQYYAAKTKARERQQENVHFHLGDYHEAGRFFETESFDRIFFLESMGHSYDLRRLISVVWTLLKPQGIVYIKDLFQKQAPGHISQTRIDNEIKRIRHAYHYDVLGLGSLIQIAQQCGFQLKSVAVPNIPIAHFEGLAISNEFQEKTGICLIQSWHDYVFPVDFLEVIFQKPSLSSVQQQDQHFMQGLSQTAASHAQP